MEVCPDAAITAAAPHRTLVRFSWHAVLWVCGLGLVFFLFVSPPLTTLHSFYF